MGIDTIRSILPLSHGISISGARNISDLISAPPINSSAVYSHRFMAYPMRSFRQIDGVPHLSTDLPSYSASSCCSPTGAPVNLTESVVNPPQLPVRGCEDLTTISFLPSRKNS